MSRLWDDTLRIPATIERTLRATDGIDAVASIMTQRTTRRIVISGNGAAWYAGFSIWLAALESRPLKADLVCVPAGLLARGRFAWRPGDVLFAISSSGEFRDLAEAVSDAGSPPVVAVTASPGSTVARAAVAKAVVGLEGETAFTHSTAYVGNVALGLAIVARATGDDSLAAAVADLPDSSAAAIRVAEEWPIADALGSWRPRTVLGVGDGPAWAAGLEMALLAREVARIPGEGAELREGATSSMFGLSPDDLALLAEVGAPDSETAQLETETVRMLEERGTRVLRLPGGRLGDRRLAAILAFPASVRAAIHLAESAGLDPDAPTTTPTYYLTARRPSEASASSKL